MTRLEFRKLVEFASVKYNMPMPSNKMMEELYIKSEKHSAKLSKKLETKLKTVFRNVRLKIAQDLFQDEPTTNHKNQ